MKVLPNCASLNLNKPSHRVHISLTGPFDIVHAVVICRVYTCVRRDFHDDEACTFIYKVCVQIISILCRVKVQVTVNGV